MGSVARNDGSQHVAFLRKTFGYADNGNVLTLGSLQAGTLIMKPTSGIFVSTVFNAGTNNFLDIGTTVTQDLFGTDLSLLATAFVPLDEAIGGFLLTADATITMLLQLSGTAATTGAGIAVISFIPPN